MAEDKDMTETPPPWCEDIPEWAWNAAFNAVPDLSSDVSLTSVVEAFARAILKAREEAFAEAVDIVDGCKLGFERDYNIRFNEALDEAGSAIRQHSQKGEK